MTIAELGIFGAVLLVGLLAGNELCALIVHVTLDRLPTAQSLAGSQAVTRQMGQLMPIFMPITIIVTFATGIATFATGIGLNNVRSALLIAAGCALVGMLVITLVGLRLIHEQNRRKWIRLHSVRVGCDIAALVLVAIAAAIN